MLATPRAALLPLLPLLLLHIPRAARAQVNPGKSDRSQVAAGAMVSFPCSLLLPHWPRLDSHRLHHLWDFPSSRCSL